MLAKAGIGEQLLAVLEKCQQSSEDERLQIEKSASDLLVLLLTGGKLTDCCDVIVILLRCNKYI